MNGPDAELHAIVAGFRDGILDGQPSDRMCYAICSPLTTFLEISGYPVMLIRGSVGEWDHYWMELADGRIIDHTADQFATPSRPMPAVYIGPKPRWYRTPSTRTSGAANR